MYSLYKRPNGDLIAHNHTLCAHGCHGRGDCRYASGKGKRWHGSFDTIKELAREALLLSHKPKFRWCDFCRPDCADVLEYLECLSLHDGDLIPFIQERSTH